MRKIREKKRFFVRAIPKYRYKISKLGNIFSNPFTPQPRRFIENKKKP